MLQRKDDSEFFMFCCIGKCPVCKKYFQVIVFCFLLYDMERNAIVKVKTDQLLRLEILCSAFAMIHSRAKRTTIFSYGMCKLFIVHLRFYQMITDVSNLCTGRLCCVHCVMKGYIVLIHHKINSYLIFIE